LEQYEGDVKKGKSKWMLWVVIGVVAIIAIVAVTKLGGGGPSSASGLTLDELSAIVSQHSTSIQGVLQWKATATEDLANLNTKQQQILSQLSGITNPKDWTSDINTLKADFTALQISWGSVNQTIGDTIKGVNVTMPRYAMVSGMEEKLTGIYVDVSVYGVGSYPVLVSLYGQNLEEDTVSVKPSSGYIIAKEYAFYNYDLDSSGAGNETVYALGMNATRRDFVILPTDTWGSVNLVQMKAVGEAALSYAFAVVGDSWAKAEEEW
jgi:hypothetical protein